MNTFYRTSSFGAIGGMGMGNKQQQQQQRPTQIIGMGGTFYGGFGAKSSLSNYKKKDMTKE